MIVGVAEPASLPAARDETRWHNLAAYAACTQHGVDSRHGLDAADVERLREQ